MSEKTRAGEDSVLIRTASAGPAHRRDQTTVVVGRRPLVRHALVRIHLTRGSLAGNFFAASLQSSLSSRTGANQAPRTSGRSDVAIL